MESSVYTVNIKTNLKAGISETEQNWFNANGFATKSVFYVESVDKKIESAEVKLTSQFEQPVPPFDVKGDPDNDKYAYQLNVVYFIPSDRVANPDYEKRISKMLLKHQLFMRKWMGHWGYGERSFGLPLNEEGLVKIVTIKAKNPKASYPYSDGYITMKPEIEDYYKENGLEWYSEHVLVITATNGNVDDTPFYGVGRWCYALDYPNMSYDSMNIDPTTGETLNTTPLATTLIGGLFHELGHGLNLPHVGATYAAKNDPQFGTSLMGTGNGTYGKKPTYLTPSCAAIMNTCQVASFTKATFYDSTTAQLTISKVIIDGGKCTVKGSFTASKKVTNVIVRFHNAEEKHLGAGYTSVAFVTEPKADNTFEIDIDIEELRANNFDYKIGGTIIMENGNLSHTALPQTYSVVNTGSGYTLESENIIGDGSWEVTTSHIPPKDDAISNAPGSLVDGNLNTCLSLVKPGKTYEGIKVDENEQVWVTIDFKKELSFNAVILTNRVLSLRINVKTVSFYGSNTNNGTDWVAIKTGAELPDEKENTVTFDSTVKYRYLKMTYDDWYDKVDGSTMQFAELSLLNKK